MLSGFKNQVIKEFFPRGISIDDNSTPIRLIHLRVNPGDVFLTNVFGPTARALFLLAAGQKPLFFKTLHMSFSLCSDHWSERPALTL
jgi:hypothetical protein